MFFLPELLLIITVDIFDVLKTNVKQNEYPRRTVS